MTADMISYTIAPEFDALKELALNGFALIRQAGLGSGEQLASELGPVLQITDVTVNEKSEQMVTGSQELGLHTDHGGVDYIVWECVAQCDDGGVSRLVDTHAVLEKLSEREKQTLQGVYLTEHQVFKGDPHRRPLLRQKDDSYQVYYSFWLLENELNARQTAAAEAFRRGVEEAEEVQIRLEPGDLLVIDNRRILHGRTAIKGNKNRLLKRYWVGEQEVADPKLRSVKGYVLPEKICEARVAELMDKGVEPAVAAIDMSMVKMKLQDADEGAGWTPAECEEAELEYKRYLTLNMRYEDRAIVPTKQIDTMWHFHILDTRAYHKDCDEVFGEYFHHFPYFGMRGDDDAQDLEDSFYETAELYEKDFGEAMLRNHAVATDCWHDCQGRCWHACSSK